MQRAARGSDGPYSRTTGPTSTHPVDLVFSAHTVDRHIFLLPATPAFQAHFRTTFERIPGNRSPAVAGMGYCVSMFRPTIYFPRYALANYRKHRIPPEDRDES